ncbi:hypothetical protein KFE25_006353 [Diacronema lutheri]|uniref:RING-type domain-containing protein n=1 Tax=Diacronema lutheri TaxID=2081491 RepID=A0A8J6CJG0_DIALT|nr:hypothetical protein KFE25_006353 [Diacronema lutheri]
MLALALLPALLGLVEYTPGACPSSGGFVHQHALSADGSMQGDFVFSAEDLRASGLSAGLPISSVQLLGATTTSRGECEIVAAFVPVPREAAAARAAGPAHARSACDALAGGAAAMLSHALRWDGDARLALQVRPTAAAAERGSANGTIADPLAPASLPPPSLRLCSDVDVPAQSALVTTPILSDALINPAGADRPGEPSRPVRPLPPEPRPSPGTHGGGGDDGDGDNGDGGGGGGGGSEDARPFIAVLAPAQQRTFGQEGEPLLIPGHHYTVRWVSRGELGLLRVELHQAAAEAAGSYWLLSEGVVDDGAWDFFVTPGEFPDGSGYRLRLVSTLKPDVGGDSGLFVIKSSSFIYVSWVLLMLTMVGTMCCTLSVCRAVQQARHELRRAEQRRGAARRLDPAPDGGLATQGDDEASEEEGDGEEGEEGDDELPPERQWRPGTPPEEQLAQVTISRFQCCICLEHAIDSVFVPCGHQVACGRCAQQCETCPICRAEIERCLKVFHK